MISTRFFGQLACLIALVCTSASCTVVGVTEPVGKHPTDLDKGDINGQWVMGEGCFSVRTTDADNGKIAVAWVDDDDGTFTLKTCSGWLRQHGKQSYLTLTNPDPKPDAPELCYWGLVSFDGNQATLIGVDSDQIEKMIKNGRLPGKKEGEHDLRLGSLTDAQVELLGSPEALKWTEPVVMHRLKE